MDPSTLNEVTARLESEEAVKGARQRAAETGRAGEPQVERFEVILDPMA